MQLLDKMFLIHHWGGKTAVKTYLDTNEEETFITTTNNLNEIAAGRRLQGQFDPHAIGAVFDWAHILSLSIEHVYTASELEAELRERDGINRDGVNALAGNVVIGGVARAEGATVVSRNREDVELLGVPVDTY